MLATALPMSWPYFHDRVAVLDVGQRDLVADRHVHLGLQVERRIVRRHHDQHVGSGLQPFDRHDADRVFFFVDQ